MTMSSDKISVLREPLTLLSLSLANNNGKSHQEVIMELPREDLQRMIDTLEKVNQVSSFFKFLCKHEVDSFLRLYKISRCEMSIK